MLEAVSQLLKYTTLKKGHSKSIIGYIIGAKNAATALNAAYEVVSDSLVVAIALKGVPGDYTPIVAVITQQERI